MFNNQTCNYIILLENISDLPLLNKNQTYIGINE